jgi:hypothetical protein
VPSISVNLARRRGSHLVARIGGDFARSVDLLCADCPWALARGESGFGDACRGGGHASAGETS